MSGNHHPWPEVRLNDILTCAEELVALDDMREYVTITVKRRHGGLEPRERLFGHQIKTKKQYRLLPGAFIISRVQCWHQAYAMVPEDIPENMIASTNYDQFTISPAVDRRFFWWFSHSPLFTDTVRSSAFGVVIEKMVFNRDAWLEKKIPLPPLDEQRRIIARIEELAAKIAEARDLKAYTAAESANFWKVLSRIARETNYPSRALGETVEFHDGRRIPLSKAEREGRKGRYPYYGASGVIDHIDDFIFDEDLLLLSEDGANLLYRSSPIAFIARGKYWVNNHAHVLRPLPGLADMKFLEYALADYDVSVFNFASAQPKLNQNNAAKISFPLPPLPEQRRIVAYLNKLQAEVDALKELQSETAGELDALMPSILSKAFRGEL
jgi:type I restriction enzyme, S subunit